MNGAGPAGGSPEPRAFYSDDTVSTETYDVRAALHIAGTVMEGDVEFYLDLARRTGGPVLDIGSGTGRIAVPLAEAGFEVVGVDLSASMLALAEARRSGLPPEVAARLSFVRADMTELDVGRRFPLIITPFRCFQFLLTPEAQRAALARFRAHLAPGGRLVVDVFDPKLQWLVPDLGLVPGGPVGPRGEVRNPVTGLRVALEVTERANDPVTQVFHETWRHTELDDSGAVVRVSEEVLAMRWTYRWELRHLLELEGFSVVEELGDFRGGPPGYGKEQIVVAAAG